jgi:hypothetical protein
MKQTVDQLREGWYGYPEDNGVRKEGVDCGELFDTAIRHANKTFIPLCGGISGTIGNLVVDPNFEESDMDIPIDMLVLTAAKEAEETVEE